jgi:hypothetical protein
MSDYTPWLPETGVECNASSGAFLAGNDYNGTRCTPLPSPVTALLPFIPNGYERDRPGDGAWLVKDVASCPVSRQAPSSSYRSECVPRSPIPSSSPVTRVVAPHGQRGAVVGARGTIGVIVSLLALGPRRFATAQSTPSWARSVYWRN